MEKTIKTLDGKTINLVHTIEILFMSEANELMEAAAKLNIICSIKPIRVVGANSLHNPKYRYVVGFYVLEKDDDE